MTQPVQNTGSSTPSVSETGGVGSSQPLTSLKGVEVGATGSFSNMDQLKNEAPEVYQAILDSLMDNIISDLQAHARRLKEAMKESNSQNQA